MRLKPKVDARLVQEAKALRAKGQTQEEIAVALGVSQGTISLVLRALGMGGPLVRQPALFTLLRRRR